MTKPKLGIISLFLIGGAAVPWLIQRQSDRNTINSLQTQLEQLARQQSEEECSVRGNAQVVSAAPNEERSELLKLRGEVGVLRGQTNELRKLLAENRQARSDVASGKQQRQPSLAAGDLVPVESLAFAGYATPEATFQSITSSFAKGDNTFLDGFTLERRQTEENNRTGKSAAELAKLSAHLAAANVRIVDSRLSSENEAHVVVYITTESGDDVKRQKEAELTTLTMKRIGDEWKVSSERH